MKSNSLAALRGAVLGMAAIACLTLPAMADGISVEGAWSRATPPAASTGALYGKITNSSPAPDRLVAIETPAAKSGEVHEIEMDKDIMRMRPVAGGLEIAPGATVALEPGGLHGMLRGLTGPLQAGQNYEAILVFEKAGRVGINVAVRPIGAQVTDHDHGHKDHGHKDHGAKTNGGADHQHRH